MTIRLITDGEIEQDFPQLIKEKFGIRVGQHLGGGCYAETWTRWGSAKTRVIKAITCPITVDFLTFASEHNNPHFPKDYEYIGIVGYHDGETEENGNWGRAEFPIHLVSCERLYSARWWTNPHLETMRKQTAVDTVGSYDPCASLSNAIKKLEAMQHIPRSLYNAFNILRDITSELIGCYGSGLSLDLHAGNYMMRKGGVLVINDPFCDNTQL